MARGIFSDRGSNPRLLYWQAESLPLRHQGSPGHSFKFFAVKLSNPHSKPGRWAVLLYLLINKGTKAQRYLVSCPGLLTGKKQKPNSFRS